MKSQDFDADAMRCPKCGSQYTQSLPTAFAYTSRLFREDVAADAMPASLEPPVKRSEVLWPTFYGGLVFGLIYLPSVFLAFESGFLPVEAGSVFDWRLLLPSAVGGFIVDVFLIARAARWNRHVYPDLLETWHATAICRRCSTQFRFRDAPSRTNHQ